MSFMPLARLAGRHAVVCEGFLELDKLVGGERGHSYSPPFLFIQECAEVSAHKRTVTVSANTKIGACSVTIVR